MNNEPNKPFKNTLFNPSVTGSTYEDFAQHAMLFPAQEPPVEIPNPESTEQTTSTSSSNFTIEPTYPPFGEITIQDYNNQEGTVQNYTQLEHQQTSNISSLFSSFSSIWKQNPTTQSEVNQPIIEENIQQPTVTTEHATGEYFQPTGEPEITLYSPSEIPKPTLQAPPPPTGSTNTYRRSGSRKAVYAPVPGLSKATQDPTPLVASTPQNTSTLETTNSFPLSNYFQPVTSILNPEIITDTPRPTASTTPKQFVPDSSAKVSECNSPFLSPVRDLSSLPETDSFVNIPASSSMPTMSVNDVSNSNNLTYAYRQDNFLSTANADIVNSMYRPVYHHWFFKKSSEGKNAWEPFSMHDSQNLDAAFTSTDLTPETVVATDGGRYDVNILRRERLSVYWKSEPTEVKRCSWFHKGNSDGKYVPFEENIAAKLEEEYKIALETNQWHRKVDTQNGETVVFHGPDVLMLFPATPSPDAWGNPPPNQLRPRLVKRGMDEFDIDEGESEIVDHLLFMVHGIGAACDLKFRSVEEVVDEFRSIALQLVRAHYRSSCDRKVVNRVEILPISWHEKLHSDDTGIDNKLKSITLESIPKLREFTNDTLLDILFYTSPVFGQTIISSVSNELNSIYDLFKQRNPSFSGGVSLGGHSLGSLILFDILRNQRVPSDQQQTELNKASSDDDAVSPLQEKPHPMNRSMSRRFSYMLGTVGTGQPEIIYPQLSFQPHTFFALGSPIGMFVTVRGLEALGETFKFPTCPGFFNIFHPYDPVAYRIEALVNEKLADVKPVLIPHHKGRKRMHLELKDTMTRVGADIKQKLIDSMKSTWNSLFQLGWTQPNKPQMQPSLEAEVDKVIQEGFATGNDDNSNLEHIHNDKTDLCLGVLNNGRRIDYVLQEAPVEFFNEYIFTLSSHLCYWESEDTILMILKEIYGTLKVSPDNQIPQQTMTIERPLSTSYLLASPTTMTTTQIGIDPTLPMNRSTEVGPPPVSGFVKKS